MTPSSLAIRFEPDGYILDGPKLMGRQSAGNAFLRAAVAGREAQATLFAETPLRASAELFRELVTAIDPAAKTGWMRPNRFDLLGKVGTLYLPGPGLAEAAQLRLRAGVAAYSITGVTHTTASHRAMDSITQLLSGPVMPWDALICTSAAVAKTVRLLLAAEADYLKWRLGAERITLPQLPVIPLGVHCDDFVFTADERERARREFGLRPDQVVVLFVGRLSFHAKAHPYPMYVGLEAAAARTGRPIALVQCGTFPNQAIEDAFRDGARRFCPGCAAVFADGAKPEERRRAWASADIFLSLSDNIQETFGLTPIEGMAAGLPVLATDWNGYKDTVRDGLDGFRVPTWLPPATLGESMSLAYEAGVRSYDQICHLTSRLTSVDMGVLVDRLTDLVNGPDLRRRLGEAGRARARSTFDWSVIFAQYQALWRDLAGRRATEAAALAAGAPEGAPARMNPFRAFNHYATHELSGDTLVERADGSIPWRDLVRHPLFSLHAGDLPGAEVFDAVLHAVQLRERTLQQLVNEVAASFAVVATAVSFLGKMGVVRLVR